MSVNYREVLQDMDARIETLEKELETLRSARPGVAMLSEKLSLASEPSVGPRDVGEQKYANMGTTAAIRNILSCGELLTRDEIYTRLKAGGWHSNASSPLSIVSATLAQANDVEKVEDRFRKKALERVLHGRDVEPSMPTQPSHAGPGTWQAGIDVQQLSRL